jgi:hypothetical protein
VGLHGVLRSVGDVAALRNVAALYLLYWHGGLATYVAW